MLATLGGRAGPCVWASTAREERVERANRSKWPILTQHDPCKRVMFCNNGVNEECWRPLPRLGALISGPSLHLYPLYPAFYPFVYQFAPLYLGICPSSTPCLPPYLGLNVGYALCVPPYQALSTKYSHINCNLDSNKFKKLWGDVRVPHLKLKIAISGYPPTLSAGLPLSWGLLSGHFTPL